MTNAHKTEFGDFQTPLELARQVATFLAASGEEPETVVEPTCGRGSFLVATREVFPGAKALLGFDIDPGHVLEARHAVTVGNDSRCHIECRDFFQTDWSDLFDSVVGDILVVGNPPWVTNSQLGAMGSRNLPAKSNFLGHSGFAAKTGKANFDISEWMLIRLLEAMHRRRGCLAMLTKIAVARKALRYAWLNRFHIGGCSLHTVDAAKHFGVSVEACLTVVHTGTERAPQTAVVYEGLSFAERKATLGLVGEDLVADVDNYSSLRDLDGECCYAWRSGVKHDAASIMEFVLAHGIFVNGENEFYELEDTYLFPLLKSSDLANDRLTPSRQVLLTQRKPSDDTAAIEAIAPRTWAYLSAHARVLDARRSIIYTKRPRFAVFGIGDYAFSPWKVAVSGLYKSSVFRVLGKHHGKPVVLDDTCYFIPCTTENEARFVCDLLNSEVCQRFLRAVSFFDSKRPITTDVLNRMDLWRVAKRLGRTAEAGLYLPDSQTSLGTQLLLVSEDKREYRRKGTRKRL